MVHRLDREGEINEQSSDIVEPLTSVNNEENSGAEPQVLEQNESSIIDENIQPRRSERERKPPVRFSEYYDSLFETYSEPVEPDVPNTFKDVEKSPEREKWIAAIQEELNSMEKNNVWTLIKRPDKIKTLKSKWIFKIKTDALGKPVRYKARLVAKGFLQKEGIDFEDTYAPVAKFATIRTLLAVGVARSMFFHQLDVKTAFLYGNLKENIYLELPEGMKADSLTVLKLRKSLYGLKQSPRCWNAKFNTSLIKMGLERSLHDSCLYTRIVPGHTIYLVIYVDDVLIAGDTEKDIEELKQELTKVFEMSDCGHLSRYLGTSIEYNKEKGIMYLDQINSIQNILKTYGMEDSKAALSPMEKGLQLQVNTEGITDQPYRELLGRLMYLMLSVRPDICYAVGYMGRFQQTPSDEHWIALKRILRYLRGTQNMKLTYNRNINSQKLEGYVDADWGSCIQDRKSTSGYIFYVYGCPVSWCSKKQQTVATSSSEAEYVAVSAATSEGLWLRGILMDMEILKSEETFVLHEDNAGCIAMAKNMECKRSKHIDIKHHFVRDHVAKGILKIVYIPTNQQVADVFTKSLDNTSFIAIRKLILLN